FGYRAYFANEKYVTTAATVESSLLCLIPMDTITTLVSQNNDLQKKRKKSHRRTMLVLQGV
ncbi:hypothetical protein EZS27_033577, partial [termite gut metagenome]